MVSQEVAEPLNYSCGVYLPQVIPDSAPDALLPSQGDGAAPGAEQWWSHNRLESPLL